MGNDRRITEGKKPRRRFRSVTVHARVGNNYGAVEKQYSTFIRFIIRRLLVVLRIRLFASDNVSSGKQTTTTDTPSDHLGAY